MPSRAVVLLAVGLAPGLVGLGFVAVGLIVHLRKRSQMARVAGKDS